MTPEERELVDGFAEEAEGLLNKARESLEEIENGDVEAEAFAIVAGQIDGIMGCAKTLGLGTMPALVDALKVISNLAEGCKHLGYKAAQIKSLELMPIAAGFLIDAVDMIEAAVTTLKKGYVSHDSDLADKVRERLAWLSARLKLSPQDQKELLARFGLN